MQIPKYELSFWLTPDLNEQETAIIFSEIVKKIESSKGQIIFTAFPQLKPISYQIKKATNGYFSIIQFSGTGIDLKEFKKEISLNEKILRFMIIRIPEIKQKLKPKGMKQPFSLKTKEFAKKESVSEVPPAKKEMTLEELDQKLNEILKEQ